MTRINTLRGHHVRLCTCTASPQAIPSGRVGQIVPSQDPDFDQQHADNAERHVVAPQGIDSRRWTMCVCDRCV